MKIITRICHLLQESAENQIYDPGESCLPPNDKSIYMNFPGPTSIWGCFWESTKRTMLHRLTLRLASPLMDPRPMSQPMPRLISLVSRSAGSSSSSSGMGPSMPSYHEVTARSSWFDSRSPQPGSYHEVAQDSEPVSSRQPRSKSRSTCSKSRTGRSQSKSGRPRNNPVSQHQTSASRPCRDKTPTTRQPSVVRARLVQH